MFMKVPDIGKLDSSVEVKFSGDGAPFSKTTSYVLLSFSLPGLENKINSAGH